MTYPKSVQLVPKGLGNISKLKFFFGYRCVRKDDAVRLFRKVNIPVRSGRFILLFSIYLKILHQLLNKV